MMPDTLIKEHHNDLTQKNIEKRSDKRNVIKIKMPKIMSLINNFDHTTNCYNEIISNLNKKCIINLDFKDVDIITPDALLYFISIIRNLNKSDIAFVNLFNKENTRYDYFFKNNKLKVLSGENVSVYTACNIIDFIIKHSQLSLVDTKFIYNILIELMTNTYNHAYKDFDKWLNSWYVLTFIDKISKLIKIVFVDTGKGIPFTMEKKYNESIKLKEQNKYIISAIRGDLKLFNLNNNGGTGLPELLEHFKKRKIKKLIIFSGRGKVELNNNDKLLDKCGYELKKDLQGTLYYLEIDLGKD